MDITLTVTRQETFSVFYLKAKVEVRYWEDAYLNGVEDVNGEMALRVENDWCPIIELATGKVLGWPEGIKADIHYKVCDAGLYWLLDADMKPVLQYGSSYVPDIMSPKENGYGDYIIMTIGTDGIVENWRQPTADEMSRWKPVSKP